MCTKIVFKHNTRLNLPISMWGKKYHACDNTIKMSINQSFPSKIALKWLSQDLTDDKSALVFVPLPESVLINISDTIWLH